jgi:cytochrome c oxidase subunit 2
MPYFRAQMNCVPGMVTEFAFEPIYTTAEYRKPYMVKKVANINAIVLKSIGLVAQGKAALDPSFDYFYVTRFVVHRIITCR